MESSVIKSREMTIYQLSQYINVGYKLLVKQVAELESKGVIKCVGVANTPHKPKIYKFTNDVIKQLESLKTVKKVVSESVASSIITDNIEVINNLHEKLQESSETIKSLNELLTSKDRELSKIQMDCVKLDSDLKVANSEIKLLTTGKNIMDSEIARLTQEKESLSNELKESNKKVQVISLICACVVGVALVLLVKTFLNL